MGKIYLHEETRDRVVIAGSQRALAQITLQNLFLGLLDYDADETRQRPAWQRRFFGPALQEMVAELFGHQAKARVELMLTSGMTPTGMVSVAGKDIDTFCLMLNTALVAGSPPIQFLARLHGSCEAHAWVDGPDRAWLAQIIETGIERYILFDDAGWQDAVQALRARNNAPMVFSYSVSDSFPNAHVARMGGWKPNDPDNPSDEFYDLSHAEQWRLALKGLLADNDNPALAGNTRQLKPDNWNSFYFGHGLNVFKLIARFQRLLAE